MEPIEYTAESAERFLAEGTPGAAEVIARAALTHNPRDPKLWSVLGRVAGAVGEGFLAERYGAVAVALDGHGGPRSLSLSAAPREGLPERQPECFLLIKAWGYGFFSDLDHVLGCLLLAEMTGRTPVTHWGTNSLFRIDSGQDAFRSYFEALAPDTADDLKGKGHDFWPPRWNDTNLREERMGKHTGPQSRMSAIESLNRPERVVVSDYHTSVSTLVNWLRPGHPKYGKSVVETIRYLMMKYLRPAPDVRAQVDEFVAGRFLNRPVIAAHVRGSDKFIEDPQHEQRIAYVMKSVDFQLARSPVGSVFLMTDSSPIVEAYKKRYGPRLITADCTRTNTRTGLHYLGTKDRRRLGVEVLRDALLALRSDVFVGMGTSNVACAIYHWKDWVPGAIVLLGTPMNHVQDPMQFMNVEQLKRHFEPKQVDVWLKSWV